MGRVPRGKVISYKSIAIAAGRTGAARVVGNILNKNKNFVTTPCHRIIRSDGAVGGYARGAGEKIRLLKEEGIIIYNRKIVNKKIRV